MSNKLQSVIFPKTSFTEEEAMLWLQENELEPIKPVDVTANFLRYRIAPPSDFDRFITQKLGNGIGLVIGASAC